MNEESGEMSGETRCSEPGDAMVAVTTAQSLAMLWLLSLGVPVEVCECMYLNASHLCECLYEERMRERTNRRGKGGEESGKEAEGVKGREGGEGEGKGKEEKQSSGL